MHIWSFYCFLLENAKLALGNDYQFILEGPIALHCLGDQVQKVSHSNPKSADKHPLSPGRAMYIYNYTINESVSAPLQLHNIQARWYKQMKEPQELTRNSWTKMKAIHSTASWNWVRLLKMSTNPNQIPTDHFRPTIASTQYIQKNRWKSHKN